MLRPLPGALGARRRLSAGLLALSLVTAILYLGVRPAYSDVSVGGNAGSFLQFEVGGRPSGMGGAQVGSAAGIMAQYWNPAALASLEQPQVGAMHAAWLQDLKYEWLGYARPLSSALGVGSLSLAYFHLPSISGADAFGNPTGDFKVYDMAFTMGLARNLGRGISVGANLKAIRQNLATVSATGPAADFGAMATRGGTSFGIVEQNIGPKLSFDGSASYPLPHQLRLGLSRAVANGRVLLATDYNMPSDYYDDVRVGAEIRAHPNISLRLGYRREIGAGNDPGNGMSYGLGINLRQMTIDYAMTPDNDFADVHRLSFGYSFGSGGAEKEPKPKKKPEEKKPAPPTPTGPPVIAQVSPKLDVPKPVKATEATPKSVTPVRPAPSPIALAPAAPQASAPAEALSDFVIVLPGFSSKETAQAEIKALDLLGFRTKDARIEKDPRRGGYQITLTRMKSKGKADEMASSLQRMSFRAIVDLAQK